MIERLPSDLLKPLHQKAFEGNNADLNMHVGNFVSQFGVAEMWITHILLWALQLTDFDRTDYLMRGMDARVKCERVRRACKAYNPLGPYLSAKLTIFEKDCIATRNNLAHSWPFLNSSTRIIQFVGMTNLPNPETTDLPTNLPKSHGIHIDDLFSQAVWLNGFAGDIHSALMGTKRGAPLEVAESRRNQPPEVP